MKKYHVTIEWGSYAGNPCQKVAIVDARDHGDALRILTERVRRYKRCRKIFGGVSIEAN
jgi:hypothetical protein